MIARKITYKGNFTPEVVGTIYDITRKNEITGEVKAATAGQVELFLEGDAAAMKLIQHQIEHKMKALISEKNVEQIPYQYYKGVVLLS